MAVLEEKEKFLLRDHLGRELDKKHVENTWKGV